MKFIEAQIGILEQHLNKVFPMCYLMLVSQLLCKASSSNENTICNTKLKNSTVQS